MPKSELANMPPLTHMYKGLKNEYDFTNDVVYEFWLSLPHFL